jgi:hypothetical protein
MCVRRKIKKKLDLNIKSKTQAIQNSLGQVVTPVLHSYEETNKRENSLLESGSSSYIYLNKGYTQNLYSNITGKILLIKL